MKERRMRIVCGCSHCSKWELEARLNGDTTQPLKILTHALIIEDLQKNKLRAEHAELSLQYLWINPFACLVKEPGSYGQPLLLLMVLD